ncbi:rRNA-processing protein bfr2 [Tulasnella sp. 419]|nr:rRNA-processing protein bfr2 [Tulasnella sp. 419]
MSRSSLAQQLAQLEDAAPIDFDPEDAFRPDAHVNDDGGDKEVDHAAPFAGREHYLEVGPSQLRNRQQLDSIADPKYVGVRTSRSKIFDEDEDGEDEDEDESMKDPDEDEESDERESDEDAMKDDGQGFEKQSNGREDSEGSQTSEGEEQDEEDEDKEDNQLADALRKTREQDRLKGKAITRQLAIWDSLLDARIKLQKAVIGCNRLPPPDKLGPYVSSSSEAGQQAVRKLLEESLKLSDDLFELQELLFSAASIEVPPSKRRKISQDPDNEDYEEQVLFASKELASLEAAAHPNLIQTLDKWSAKVAAVTPTTSTKFNAQPPKSAVQLIAESASSGNKLLAKTRVRRGGAASMSRIGEERKDSAAEDVEVFDDVDFYQQLLRDVIDSRSGKEGLNGGESEAWSIRRQTQRKESGKKYGDSRASKGRRLKYDVHEKLQNFMVPVLSARKWHEEQIDELFASLLGKGFEGAAAEEIGPRDNADGDAGMDLVGLVGGDLGGLKVF